MHTVSIKNDIALISDDYFFCLGATEHLDSLNIRCYSYSHRSLSTHIFRKISHIQKVIIEVRRPRDIVVVNKFICRGYEVLLLIDTGLCNLKSNKIFISKKSPFDRIIDVLLKKRRSQHPEPSVRDAKILSWWHRGVSVHEIADRLSISKTNIYKLKSDVVKGYGFHRCHPVAEYFSFLLLSLSQYRKGYQPATRVRIQQT